MTYKTEQTNSEMQWVLSQCKRQTVEDNGYTFECGSFYGPLPAPMKARLVRYFVARAHDTRYGASGLAPYTVRYDMGDECEYYFLEVWPGGIIRLGYEREVR